ncbi:MAG: HXXEE domain-containing protein [Gemmatimonadetes bacterium]|nr:HXXEE domain-containing protein [Gemmatimonadota bacterium]
MANRRLLAVAFPISYAVHLTEEAVAGSGFPAWLKTHAGADLSGPEFLLLNAVGMTVMLVVAVGVWRNRSPSLGLAAIGTIGLINGSLHLGGSVLTASYSPGAVSGTLLWMPLGALAIRRAAERRDRSVLGGVALGLAAHAAISLGALRM